MLGILFPFLMFRFLMFLFLMFRFLLFRFLLFLFLMFSVSLSLSTTILSPEKMLFPSILHPIYGTFISPGSKSPFSKQCYSWTGIRSIIPLKKRKFISSNRFNVNIGKRRNFFPTYLKYHVSLLEKEKVLCL